MLGEIKTARDDDDVPLQTSDSVKPGVLEVMRDVRVNSATMEVRLLGFIRAHEIRAKGLFHATGCGIELFDHSETR